MYLRLELLGLFLELGRLDVEEETDEDEEESDPTFVDRQYPMTVFDPVPADPIGFRLEQYPEESE